MKGMCLCSACVLSALHSAVVSQPLRGWGQELGFRQGWETSTHHFDTMLRGLRIMILSLSNDYIRLRFSCERTDQETNDWDSRPAATSQIRGFAYQDRLRRTPWGDQNMTNKQFINRQITSRAEDSDNNIREIIQMSRQMQSRAEAPEQRIRQCVC